ncbi:membrane protein [Dictyobacter alpinus]|uniref:Membrane protein n=2 Tax=Dictyobacter alpinus TaxID=2014873 RepID=A0A402B7G4_9CHLR|nr:hypothetical protein [Dictyobacter alpinus]GCE27288.1 membrane protein [Dictyobacter alpinus]
MRKTILQRQSVTDTEANMSDGAAAGRSAAQPVNPAMRALKKVPEITVFFWIIKLLTTAMGEVTSDYLAHQLDPIIAVAIGGIGLVAALVLQFWVRRYIPWVYWLAVVMVAVFGTMAADVLHVGFGVPYIASTALFLIALAIIFAVWYKSEKTLSIHSIYTRRRELFYWATVIATFALGTAAGDLTATNTSLGYLSSGILFAILIALPALAYWLLGLNEILAFWLAYILTRPLGASFADWLGKAPDQGGIGIGTGVVSLVLTALIVILVGYLTVTHKDVEPETR